MEIIGCHDLHVLVIPQGEGRLRKGALRDQDEEDGESGKSFSFSRAENIENVRIIRILCKSINLPAHRYCTRSSRLQQMHDVDLWPFFLPGQAARSTAECFPLLGSADELARREKGQKCFQITINS
jgi:hypothetical protein